MSDIDRDDALEYHSGGRPGKTEVVPTKPTATQRDLALAYTPGVAKPCLEIAREPGDVYKYTNKGNLVAVISNGTAVLGLGNIGAAAGKPVMEGKAVLFKRFADIDVFDLELDTRDTEAFINAVKIMEPTFGGINLEDIDVLFGLSVGGIVKGDMIQGMAKDPVVFAMANPDPEIPYDDAVAARPDVIMATGRSDYPNQVNNVLGFPFIFRGALDCRATTINDEMKLAASNALAELAKEDVPDSVLRAYGKDRFAFGREYLIPKPFDYRVLLNVPVAVARSAAETGVAQHPITDYDAYRRKLESMLGRSRGVMQLVFDRAKRDPKRIVFPEGDQEKIVRAAKVLIDENIAHPILLVKREEIAGLLKKYNVDESKMTTIDVSSSPDR